MIHPKRPHPSHNYNLLGFPWDITDNNKTYISYNIQINNIKNDLVSIFDDTMVKIEMGIVTRGTNTLRNDPKKNSMTKKTKKTAPNKEKYTSLMEKQMGKLSIITKMALFNPKVLWSWVNKKALITTIETMER